PCGPVAARHLLGGTGWHRFRSKLTQQCTLPMHGCNRDRVLDGGYEQQGRADTTRMAGEKAGKPVKGKAQKTKKRGPDWTSGLKQLYDSVVEEPIPDTFKDLLSRLDSGKQ